MVDDALLKQAAVVGDYLSKHHFMLSLAESCTGGLAASYITAIAGSSAWFDTGYVTYSNLAKMQLLQVRSETLESHGAVSEATAIEMAQGALKNGRANIAAAITGIAGPGGGAENKPVGMVCFAWATLETLRSQTYYFTGDRLQIRQQSVAAVFDGLQAMAGPTK